MPRLVANVAFTSAHALGVGGREGTALGTEGATCGHWSTQYCNACIL